MTGTLIRRGNTELFPDDLIDRLLAAIDEEAPGAALRRIEASDAHSNDLAVLSFDDDRTLIVKRARYDWAAPRFDASRRAAALLRRSTGIVAPGHLALPADLDDRPMLAYWRIPLPTLEELWPGIPTAERPAVLRSWGALLRRVHDVRLTGSGPLAVATREAAALRAFLERDLVDRLLPAVAGTWPAGVATVERLIEAVGDVADLVADAPAVLIHNDLHMGNVLCETTDGAVRCVGVLDLEAAFAGPAEADLAHTEVLHGPLFAHPLDGPWLDHLREGYGRALDPFVLAFFRAFHLANLGFHAALTGDASHAAEVAAAAAAEVERVAPRRGHTTAARTA